MGVEQLKQATESGNSGSFRNFKLMDHHPSSPLVEFGHKILTFVSGSPRQRPVDIEAAPETPSSAHVSASKMGLFENEESMRSQDDDPEIIVQLKRAPAQVQTLPPPPKNIENSNPEVVEEKVVVQEMSEASLKTDVIAQFDPLIPQDWMIKFDSPKDARHSLPPSQLVPVTPAPSRIYAGGALRAAPSLSLLDSLSNDFGSPNSIPKYTERDVSKLKSELRNQNNSEVEIVQSELQRLDQQLKESEAARGQMKSVVEEYERAMNQMIEDARQEKERHKITIDKMNEERARTNAERTTLETSLKELRVKYEELRLLNEQYRKNELLFKQNIDTLHKDIKASEQRLEALKQHAEKKLEDANEEIGRVKAASEKELALVKAKLQKSDIKIKTLENTIEQKQAENAELMAICDDLIKKMETSPTAGS